MLTVIVVAICLCLPFIAYRFVSGGGEWNGTKDFLFNVMISLLFSVIGMGILALFILIPASMASMTEPRVEKAYASDDIELSSSKKSIQISVDGEELSFPRSSFSIRTSSDDPEVQGKLDDGECVVEVHVQVSELTLSEKRTCILYAANDSMASMMDVLDAPNSESEG